MSKQKRSTSGLAVLRRHPKKTAAGLGLGALALLAGVAWALLSADSPFTGSATGEDASATTQVVSVANGSENNAKCAWTLGADGRITLVASKVPAGVQTRCSGSVALKNTGNVELRLQSFTGTSTAGTVQYGLESGSCGRVLAPGAQVTVGPRLLVDMPVGSSATLTGKLSAVDSASWSSTSCSPVL